MIRGRWALGLLVAGAMGATLFAPVLLRDEIHVAPGDRLQAAIDDAEAGARLVVAAGTYEGPIIIDRPVEIVAEPGSVVEVARDEEPAVSVTAHSVRLEGLTTVGGTTGILVRAVEGVALEDVVVRGADLHGIEIVDGSATITGAEIGDLRSEFAQGIEIRNADGRPDSVVQGSTVTGGQEGIVSHVSEVVVRDNVVRDATLRGITVTEMSDGVVHHNTLEGIAGAGLYCGDMSRCEFRGNAVGSVAVNPMGPATAGWGLVVTYHAAASSEGDRLDGEAGAVFTSTGGHLRDRTPLEIGDGIGAVGPVAITTLVTLLAIAAVGIVVRRPARALGARAARAQNPARWIVPVGIAGLAVQTFHMIEHGLQVFRVRVDGVPSRGGLVGPVVEAEWVHFIYNGLVVVALVAIVLARARGWSPAGRAVIADNLLLVATAAQGYHFVEHSVKLAQHIAGGAKVNPGIAGNFFDLVLFHFGINLAVYLACVGAAVFYAFSLRTRPADGRVPHYAASRG